MLTLMPTHHPDTAMGTATEAGTAIDSDVDSLVVDAAARTLTLLQPAQLLHPRAPPNWAAPVV